MAQNFYFGPPNYFPEFPALKWDVKVANLLIATVNFEPCFREIGTLCFSAIFTRENKLGDFLSASPADDKPFETGV